MGINQRYFPKDMGVKLAEMVNADLFIETGTYKAGTIKWAATKFKRTHTIELSEELFKETEKELLSMGNITPHLGNSIDVLPKILSTETGNVIFWLDGHWSGGATAGEDNPCPLLKELDIILSRDKDDIILIDDARLVTGTDGWPTITEVYETITKYSDKERKGKERKGKERKGKEKFMLICDDNIYVVPNKDEIKKALYEYSLQRNIKQWLQIAETKT